MAILDDADIRKIVDAVVAELDRRQQIEKLVDAIIRKQGELNRKLVQAPGKYQRRQPAGTAVAPNSRPQDTERS